MKLVVFRIFLQLAVLYSLGKKSRFCKKIKIQYILENSVHSRKRQIWVFGNPVDTFVNAGTPPWVIRPCINIY